MCGGKSIEGEWGKFKQNIGHADDPFEMSMEQADKWAMTFRKIHDPLNIFAFGAPLAEGATGQTGREKAIAHDVKRAMHVNPAAEMAEPTAVLVDPSADMRNRRRRALYFGTSELRIPGPGASAPQA